MPTCLKCYKCDYCAEDRFCGLCGSALAALHIANGAQVDIPTEGSDPQRCELVLTNTGFASLAISLEAAQAEWLTLASNESNFEIRPLQSLRIPYLIDRDKLRDAGNGISAVAFRSTDPLRPHGMIYFCVSTGGKVESLTKEIALPPTVVSASETEPVVRKFTVPVLNDGGVQYKVIASLEKKSDTVNPIVVRPVAGSAGAWLADNESAHLLRGYQGETELEFEAYCTEKIDATATALELAFHPVTLADDGTLTATGDPIPVSIAFSAQFVMPPEVTAPKVEFGKSPLSPGRIELAKLELKNTGEMRIEIRDIRSTHPGVHRLVSRSITDPVIVLEPGALRNVDLILRAPYGASAGPLEGDLVIKGSTPTGERTWYIPWSAQINSLDAPQGLIAVDFGTINSCVAAVRSLEQRTPPVLLSDAGGDVIPSMAVFLNEEDFIFGSGAAEWARRNPRGVVHSIKRSILEDEIQVNGVGHSAVELAAKVIEQLLLRAGDSCGAPPEVLALAAPVGFAGPRRQRIKNACEIACRKAWGGYVPRELIIVDEPTAAAMYYVNRNREALADRIRPGAPLHIVVFDFGGGTLDVCVIQLSIEASRPGAVFFNCLVSRGNNQMGGIDLDRVVLRDLIVKRTKEKHPKMDDRSLTASRIAFQSTPPRDRAALESARFLWYESARKIKEELSSEKKATFTPPSRIPGSPDDNGKLELTRTDLEAAIGPRIKVARALVESCLEYCALSPSQIDVALLTGQSSLIPAVRSSMKDLFPGATIPTPEECPPKTCVAQGVALYARYRRTRAATGFQFGELERTSYSYGILIEELKYQFHEIIPCNIPFGSASGEISWTTSKDEPSQLTVVAHPGNTDGFVSLDQTVVLCEFELPPLNKIVELGLTLSDKGEKLTVTVDGVEIPTRPARRDEEEGYL
jgi:molecular chaperone DnaK (HSP70)